MRICICIQAIIIIMPHIIGVDDLKILADRPRRHEPRMIPQTVKNKTFDLGDKTLQKNKLINFEITVHAAKPAD
ncbi:MAG: hypothetical protein JWM11_7919 [Planctomycetaceae bacterium]|nr:hypothetical protein [Planctomycetaceae bacterium]